MIRFAAIRLAFLLLLAAGPAAAADLFDPIHAVLQHPRCANCHADGNAPLQRDGRPHTPPVQRGPEGKGATTFTACGTCHKEQNTAAIPGAPNWQMPKPGQPMVFRNRPAGALCRQLLDPAQNGGRDREALGRHFVEDPLLGWAWAPGGNRPPPETSREELVAAVIAWLRAGAPCPD